MDSLGICLKRKNIIILIGTLFVIFLFCFNAGCVNEKPYPKVTGGNISQISGTDVILPVDLPSDMISSNIMTKKNGIPGGGLIYEGLVAKNRKGMYEPVLATNWSVSDDAKTWTFHLIHNGTWHDGQPLTSSDIKFTNDYLKQNNLTMGFVLSDVASVECPDEYTVIFHLKNSYSVWPDRLAQSPGIGVYPKHLFEQIQNPKTWKDTQCIGTGPFKFDKSAAGYVRLSRNEEYRIGKSPVTGVILKLITNKDSQVLALKNGEIDVVYGLPPAVAENIRSEENIGVFSIPATTGYEMGYNMMMYPTNLLAFRKALSHSVNRESICNILGNARPSNTTFLIPEVAGDYINPAETDMYDFNLSQASELLSLAGFKKDEQGILKGPDGKPVELIFTLGGKAAVGGIDEKILAVLQNDWKTLGITLKTPKYDDEPHYRKAIYNGNIFIDGMPSILHDDPDDLVDFAVTPLQENNYYNFNNTEFNNLTRVVRNTVNREERKELGYKMQEMLAENIPTVPICSTDSFVAYRKDRFVGWEKLLDYANIQDPHVILSLKPVTH